MCTNTSTCPFPEPNVSSPHFHLAFFFVFLIQFTNFRQSVFCIFSGYYFAWSTVSLMHRTCPIHVMFLDLIIIIIYIEGYKLWSLAGLSDLCGRIVDRAESPGMGFWLTSGKRFFILKLIKTGSGTPLTCYTIGTGVLPIGIKQPGHWIE